MFPGRLGSRGTLQNSRRAVEVCFEGIKWIRGIKRKVLKVTWSWSMIVFNWEEKNTDYLEEISKQFPW